MSAISLTVSRCNSHQGNFVSTYEIQAEGTLLEALGTIKQEQDPTLSFRSGCRSGVCGCCAVRVDGVAKLACETKLSEGSVHLEPLDKLPVVRDLIVDTTASLQKNRVAIAPLEAKPLEQEALHRIEKQSECILCHSCYSACPVLATNENFLGPFALTRAWRYSADERQTQTKTIIDAIQKDGIWDCILCGDCATVCPVGINPKNDISLLRTRSAAFGYMDPSFGSFGSFGGNFGDFGFGEVTFS